MNERSRIEYLLGQIGELLNMIREHQGPITQNINPSVIAEIDRLRTMMHEFKELNQATLKDANIDMDKLKRETLGSSKISPKDAQILKKTQDLEKEARDLQAQYARITGQGRGGKRIERSPEDTKSREMKDRRKRYKPLGGDKNWIPI